jgi:hypothetical protein
MSSHFLMYSVLATNLSPKLSELDLVDAIAGHFPPCVQRALLSASVRTIQSELTFLNKLETMEQTDSSRGRPNPGPPQNRPNQSHSSGQNQYKRDRDKRNNHYVRGTHFPSNQSFRGDERYQQNYARREPYFSGRGAGTYPHGPSQEERGQPNFNPRAPAFDPSAESRQGGFNNPNRNHSENEDRTMQGTKHCPYVRVETQVQR